MNEGMNKPYFTLWIEYYSTLKKKKKSQSENNTYGNNSIYTTSLK